MAVIKSIIILGIIGAVCAGPMGGHPGGPHGGPFGELEKSLTDEQKQQLEAIFKNETATKQQIQDGVAAFFQNIGGDVAVGLTDVTLNNWAI